MLLSFNTIDSEFSPKHYQLSTCLNLKSSSCLFKARIMASHCRLVLLVLINAPRVR